MKSSKYFAFRLQADKRAVMSSSSHNNKYREMEGKELKTGKCMHAHDESMRRMMSFVEPLGHSQIVDRQSLASLPVGFVKVRTFRTEMTV